MTLHALKREHKQFVFECYKTGGYSDEIAQHESDRVVEIALAYASPYYFVGPSYDNPRYFVGAFIDDTNRAVLDVGTTGLPGPKLFADARAWLDYLLNVDGVILLEAIVWVSDLKKEWLLRGLGFKKGGVIPDKVDIPGQGTRPALIMYTRKQELDNVTQESFLKVMDNYRAHVERLESEGKLNGRAKRSI